MDLYKLKTFRTVATLLNFNQAAKTLNCAQSTISAQIKSLEDEIGVLLFKRIKKKVILTKAGEKLLDHSYKLLSFEEEALADIKGEKKDPSGIIRLLVSEVIASSYFPIILPRFLAKYPTTHFDISNCSANTLENELQIGSVDLAFMISESINVSTLKCETILTDQLVMVTHPEHPLAAMKKIDIRHLHHQTVFLPRTGCGYGLPFRQLLDVNIAKPLSIIDFTSVTAVKKCVQQGAGISILPRNSIKKELQKNQLVELDWISQLKTSVLMVWHKDKRISNLLHAFMDMTRELKINNPPVNFP